MNNVITIFLIILAEVALIEAIAIYIILKRGKGASSVDPEEARNSFKTIKGNTAHTEKLKELLQSIYRVDEEKLQETLDSILGAEYSVYSTALKGVATGDCKAIVNTQIKISDLQDQYHALVRILEGKNTDKISELESNNKGLQFDIDRLNQELKTTLTTMESTLTEYANMYAARAATDEGDENLSKLTESVDNAKQHANHTIKKLEEGSDEKRVPISEEDIAAHEKSVEEKAAQASDVNFDTDSEKSVSTEPQAEAEPQSDPERNPESKQEEESEESGAISFETMGDMQQLSEPNPIKDNASNEEKVSVELNIDGDIDLQLETNETPSFENKSGSELTATNESEENKQETNTDFTSEIDLAQETSSTNDTDPASEIDVAPETDTVSATTTASEEEITSFMLESGIEIDSILNIDPEMDADIADLLNDANDIDLSDDIVDELETDLDSQLNSTLVDNDAKVASK
ncbi:hypothetical protein MNBD_GAMMA12-2245 [hydrothermal vent metagenome]|uniref:Uncharacterized protein n=1 Tax=hydrothermal vent metagenome TaxID=652676 RepID=A0A3B0YKT5_9ZZZZ